MNKPLAIDLFCGLGGWTEGLLEEGYDVLGFDIERHVYGEHWYPAQLVLQDVLTLHGSQFSDADLIVASPPCQEFSYMAMPWTRAKQIAAALQGDGDFPGSYTGSRTLGELTALFDACFRIQREACEAAGRHIPLIVENVRGAQKWVGRARWNFGSFYLWGDVPALMPMIRPRAKNPGLNWSAHDDPDYRVSGKGACFRDSAIKNNGGSKNPGFRFDGSGRSFQSESVDRHIKNNGGSWFNVAHNTTSGKGNNPDGRKLRDQDGYKRDPPAAFGWKKPRTSSHSNVRKAASAMIAKIPLALSRHIARTFYPRERASA